MLFNVYWMEENAAKSRLFDSENLGDVLEHAEGLRKRKYAGENIAFISISSELPYVVGKQGVDVTGPDYDWKKRRV